MKRFDIPKMKTFLVAVSVLFLIAGHADADDHKVSIINEDGTLIISGEKRAFSTRNSKGEYFLNLACTKVRCLVAIIVQTESTDLHRPSVEWRAAYSFGSKLEMISKRDTIAIQNVDSLLSTDKTEDFVFKLYGETEDVELELTADYINSFWKTLINNKETAKLIKEVLRD